MSSPADVSLARLATLFDAQRLTGAIDRAVCASRAYSRSRKSRPHQSSTDAASNFASTDAKKAHPPPEQKELNVSWLSSPSAEKQRNSFRRSLRRLARAHRSVQDRCRFNLNQKFWIC